MSNKNQDYHTVSALKNPENAQICVFVIRIPVMIRRGRLILRELPPTGASIVDENTRKILRQWTLAQPVVSAFITSIVRDFSERDDILQEVAIAVLEHTDRYNESRPFLPWAIGIAQNHVRQFLRRRRSDRLVFGDGVQDLVAAAFQTMATHDPEALDHLRECLRHLDSREQLMCELRYGQNLKPAVMAERLGMAANTVSKALQRIRDQLRACIQHKSVMKTGH